MPDMKAEMRDTAVSLVLGNKILIFRRNGSFYGIPAISGTDEEFSWFGKIYIFFTSSFNLPRQKSKKVGGVIPVHTSSEILFWSL